MAPGPWARTWAACFTASAATCVRVGMAGTLTGPLPSFQAVSPGKMSVAMRPGGVDATAMASAPSAATIRASVEVFTQCDTGRAIPSISAVSGASYLI